MRILLLGEYSNVHATLAEGLRALGHEVTVVSNGDFWKDYPRDIDVSRMSGKLGGLRLMLHLWMLLPKLTDYDIVQLINPMFFELKAKRLFFFYNWLRKHNRHVVLGAFGMDYYWVHTCTYHSPLRYSDFNIGETIRTDTYAVKEQADWLGTDKERLNRLIAEDVDAIVTTLYEYHACYAPVFPDKTTFIPLPIRLSSPHLESPSEKVRIFIGISKNRSAYKGTDIMMRAAENIRRQYPDRVQLIKAEGVPFAQYQQMMDDSDVLLDQLYSYTPSMNSLLAMSKGIVVVGGGEPENYDIIAEHELRPIINVTPCYDSVYKALEQLVLHPERLPELKLQSVEYVRRHHDYLKVARQYERCYLSL